MGRIHAGITIVADEYDAFVALIPGDERLPPSYQEWAKRRAQEDAQCAARGDIVKPVVIHSEEFGAHCRALGKAPSFSILEAIAADKAELTPLAPD